MAFSTHCCHSVIDRAISPGPCIPLTSSQILNDIDLGSSDRFSCGRELSLSLHNSLDHEKSSITLTDRQSYDVFFIPLSSGTSTRQRRTVESVVLHLSRLAPWAQRAIPSGSRSLARPGPTQDLFHFPVHRISVVAQRRAL